MDAVCGIAGGCDVLRLVTLYVLTLLLPHAVWAFLWYYAPMRLIFTAQINPYQRKFRMVAVPLFLLAVLTAIWLLAVLALALWTPPEELLGATLVLYVITFIVAATWAARGLLRGDTRLTRFETGDDERVTGSHPRIVDRRREVRG